MGLPASRVARPVTNLGACPRREAKTSANVAAIYVNVFTSSGYSPAFALMRAVPRVFFILTAPQVVIFEHFGRMRSIEPLSITLFCACHNLFRFLLDNQNQNG